MVYIQINRTESLFRYVILRIDATNTTQNSYISGIKCGEWESNCIRMLEKSTTDITAKQKKVTHGRKQKKREKTGGKKRTSNTDINRNQKDELTNQRQMCLYSLCGEEINIH